MNKKTYFAALALAAGLGSLLHADNENFTYGELGGRDFSNQSLKNSTWTHADLSNVSFAGANLDGANFEDASLNGTDFTDAIITNMYWGASFTRNQLYSTASYKNKDLSGLKLEYYKFNNNLDLSGQNLNGASFRNCTLGMVDFTDAQINNVSFYSAKSFTAEKLYSTASYKNKDLSGIDFRFVDVKNWDFSGQNLSGVNFYSRDFTGADFTDSVITNTDLSGSNLTFDQLKSTASYKNKDLSGASFSSVDLAGFDFSDQIINNASFGNAKNLTASQIASTASYKNKDLSGVDFEGLDLTGLDFSGQIIKNASFCNSNYSSGVAAVITKEQLYSTKSYAVDKDLSGIDFTRSTLSGWNFAGQNLEGATFYYADVAEADFTGATVKNVSFERVKNFTEEQLYSTKSYSVDKDLSGINFTYFNVKEWDFTGQNLDGADFYYSDVNGANFADAVITNAIMTDAKNFTGEQLKSTASYKNKDLHGIRLSTVDMDNMDFSDANLRGSYLKLDGENLNFKGADLTDSTLVDGGRVDNADFSGATLKNVLINGVTLRNAKVERADFTDARFLSGSFSFIGFTEEQFRSTMTYRMRFIRGSRFSSMDMSGWDFSNFTFMDDLTNDPEFSSMNLSGANFSGSNMLHLGFYNSDLTNANFSNITATETVNFYYSDLTGANFTDAVLDHFNFYGLQSISAEQFYSTATYKNKTKANINFTDMDMSGWDLSGLSFGKGSFRRTNLKGANFMNTKIDEYSSSFSSGNNDFTAADFRGSNMTLDRFKSTDTLKNTIMTDGTIQNFSMASADDSFSIRKYVPLEGGEVISAKIAQSASISGRADLTLETGAYLEVVDGAVLTVEDGSAITINTDGSTIFEVGENSGLVFADGSVLKVNLEGVFTEPEEYSFAFINANDSSTISGLDELMGGENFLLSLNGELFDGEWDYYMEGNSFGIRMQVPEPATYAAIFGALALAFAVCRRRK